jgi:hypothetical protein
MKSLKNRIRKLEEAARGRPDLPSAAAPLQVRRVIIEPGDDRDKAVAAAQANLTNGPSFLIVRQIIDSPNVNAHRSQSCEKH